MSGVSEHAIQNTLVGAVVFMPIPELVTFETIQADNDLITTDRRNRWWQFNRNYEKTNPHRHPSVDEPAIFLLLNEQTDPQRVYEVLGRSGQKAQDAGYRDAITHLSANWVPEKRCA